MNIKGGALEFDIIANNGQLNSALEESKKRVQGFSDATVEGGERMEAAYNEAANSIEKAFKDIDSMANIHKGAINKLEKEYTELGEVAAAAFMKGTAKGDEEYRALGKKQQAIKQEIATRKNLLTEIEATADALSKEEQRLNSEKIATEKNAKAKGMLRTQLMSAKNALAEMEEAGQRGTKAFADLQREVGRLQNAMGDANTQAKILSHDNAGLQGIISAVSGFTGAMSAAQGAVGLFAGENENLQKIMVKVQSLMAITIGLQQVANTLNKDSYFTIVTLGKAKQLLSTSTLFLGKAFIKMGLSATTAKIAVAGLYATLTGGLSLAIMGIVKLIDRHNKKQEEAKQKAEEASEAYKKQQERLTDLGKKYAEQVATITTYQNALKSEKLSYDEKLKVLKKLQEIVPDYTAKLNKEGQVIWDNKAAIDAYLVSLEKTLRFKAAMEDLTEIYAEIYKLEKNAQKNVTNNKSFQLNGQEFEIYDWEALKQRRGVSGDISQSILESWRKEEEAIQGFVTEANKERKKQLEGQVSDIQKYISDNDLIDLTSNKGSGSGNPKDPYTEMLENRKKQYTQYYKWVNSKDEILQNAAKTEFAGLLAEGSSYIDFLKKQREELLALSTSSPKETEKLKKLNDEIANETKNTVLGEFEKELQNQLAGARSILEMLNILEERRKQLAGDGSDLDNSKKDIIDSEQENVAKKAKEETDALLDQYNQYLEKRINKSVEFENQMALLRRRASMAQTKEEREKIEGIVEMYEKLHELHIDSFEELDQINADSIYRLGTFEQKRLMIVQEYEKLIGAARLAGQEDVAKKLEGERDLEIMKETRQYQEFFGDISEVSIKTLENTRRVLLKMMQEAYNAGKLTADQYKKLIDEINKQADSAYKGRGFEALFGNTKGGGFMNMLFGEGDLESKLSSFKTMFSGAKTDMASIAGSSGEVAGNAGEAAGAMQGAAGGAAGTLSIIDAIIKGVYQTLRAVSDTLNVIAEYQDSIGNSDAADNLGDWADTINVINETAMSGWENLKSGNVMGAISDTISLPFKLLTTLNKIHDKKIDKAITKHADAVKDLTNAYNALSHAIENALGETVYKSQKAAIENMRQQQYHLEQMWRNEESKKKTDKNKIKEYKEQYEELGRQIKDVIEDIANDITQTTAKNLANQLGDALVEAFGKGEDAAKSFEKVANDVIKNAVLNQLKKNFLEQQLDPILKQLQKDMGFDETGGGSWNGLSDSEMDRLKRQIAQIGTNFTEQLKIYESLFKELNEELDPTTSLSGAIKGASQESIDLLAGQTNAVRVNQVEGNEIMRSQLLHLASIDAKVGVSNSYLQQIEQNTRTPISDPLRAEGIDA